MPADQTREDYLIQIGDYKTAIDEAFDMWPAEEVRKHYVEALMKKSWNIGCSDMYRWLSAQVDSHPEPPGDIEFHEKLKALIERHTNLKENEDGAL